MHVSHAHVFTYGTEDHARTSMLAETNLYGDRNTGSANKVLAKAALKVHGEKLIALGNTMSVEMNAYIKNLFDANAEVMLPDGSKKNIKKLKCEELATFFKGLG